MSMMYRVVLTKYVPDICVIYIDSLMKAFGTIEHAKTTVNGLIESTIVSFHEIYKDTNFTFEAYFPNDSEHHYAIIKQIAHNEDGSVKNELPLQLIDIFEIEKLEDGLGFKYRDEFTIVPVADDSEAGFEYYKIYMNENQISFKEDLSEAFCFIDNFIHSHVVCEAINKDMNISL